MMNEDYGKLKKKMDDAKVFIADYINNGKVNQQKANINQESKITDRDF